MRGAVGDDDLVRGRGDAVVNTRGAGLGLAIVSEFAASMGGKVTVSAADGGGFGLSVKMRVEDKSLPQADLAMLAREAHEKICPYSHATRGNVNVQFEVIDAS